MMTDQEMKQLYNEGNSLREVAEAAGVSYQTVANRLRAIGVKLRARGDVKGKYDKSGIISSLRSGWIASQVAKSFGCPVEYVYLTAKKAGIDASSAGVAAMIRARAEKAEAERDEARALAIDLYLDAHGVGPGRGCGLEEVPSWLSGEGVEGEGEA